MTTKRFDRRVRLRVPGEWSPGRRFSVAMGETSQLRELRVWHVPLVVAQEHARWRSRQGMGTGEGEAPAAPGLDETANDFPMVAAIQLVWDRPDGIRVTTPPIGPVPRGPVGEEPAPDEVTELGWNETCLGIHGTYCWGRLTSLGVVTPSSAREPMGTAVGTTFLCSIPTLIGGTAIGVLPEDMTDLSTQALASGVIGRSDARGLKEVGLRISVPGVGPSPLVEGDGRFVTSDSTSDQPWHEDLGAIAPLGEGGVPTARFARRSVGRLSQWDDELRFESLGGELTARFVSAGWDARLGRRVDHYTDGDGTPWRAYLPTDARPTRIEVGYAGTDVWTLMEPVLPEEPEQGGPGWDNVFALEHRPAFLSFLFNGIDIARLNPFDLQSPSRAIRERVFAAPGDSSGYHVAADAPKLVPNGWHLGVDHSGNTSILTASTASQKETRHHWARNLGIDASVDVLGASLAYSNNSSASATFSNSNETGTTTTSNQAVTRDHYVVIDPALVQLDREFAIAVNEAAEIAVAAQDSPSEAAVGERDRRIDELILRFGAHYANAVTYGTTSIEHRYYRTESISRSSDTDSSHEESVKEGFKQQVAPGESVGFSAGANAGGSSGSGSSSRDDNATDTTGIVTVGSEAHPVPVLLDVEPITTLLSPVFFPDPAVHSVLRPDVEAALLERGAALLGAVADPSAPTDGEPGRHRAWPQWLLAYRPGSGEAQQVAHTNEVFRTVESATLPGRGIGSFDLASRADAVISFDYTGSGSMDHLVLYRPGSGAVQILELGRDPVYSSRDRGIGGFDLKSPADRVIAFDYVGRRRLDHLLAYRPGTGMARVIQNEAGTFTTSWTGATSGIGGFALDDARDRLIAFDGSSQGRADHLLAYRPGTGMVHVLAPRKGAFESTYSTAKDGIAGLRPDGSSDRIIAIDGGGSGGLDHLVLYRPGSGEVALIAAAGGAFETVLRQKELLRDLAGGVPSQADRVIAIDWEGTGRSDHLMVYRPGTGAVHVLARMGDEFEPVYSHEAQRPGLGRFDLADPADRVVTFDRPVAPNQPPS